MHVADFEIALDRISASPYHSARIRSQGEGENMRMDRLCVAVSALCLWTAGCFSYAPYGQPGPYGGVPHTAMGPQPLVGGAPPGTVWVPASPGKPILGQAGVNAPEPARRGNSATPDAFAEPSDGRSVPDPVEPGRAKPTEVTEPFGLNEETVVPRRATLTSQRSRTQRDDDTELVNTSRDTELELTPVAEDVADTNLTAQTADFSTQVRSQDIQPVSSQGIQTVSPQTDKFGYDAEGYTWLRGVAEFDRADQTWHLTYSTSPDKTDQYGGEVTFKNTAHFKVLRHREAIRVEGQFDPDQRDRLGKPVYEVNRLIRAAR